VARQELYGQVWADDDQRGLEVIGPTCQSAPTLEQQTAGGKRRRQALAAVAGWARALNEAPDL
jgi:hypothetical protein